MDEFFETHFVKKFVILFLGGSVGAILGGRTYIGVPYQSHGEWSFEIGFPFFAGMAIGVFVAIVFNFIFFRAIPKLLHNFTNKN